MCLVLTEFIKVVEMRSRVSELQNTACSRLVSAFTHLNLNIPVNTSDCCLLTEFWGTMYIGVLNIRSKFQNKSSV